MYMLEPLAHCPEDSTVVVAPPLLYREGSGTFTVAGHSDEEIDRDMALAYMGLKPTTSGGKLADSADPMWLDRESPPPTVPIVSHDTGAPSNGQVRESFYPFALQGLP